MPTVHIKPLGKSIHAAKGSILRDILTGEGILLDYPCGGKGSCRKCRVSVDPPPASGTGNLKETETIEGVRLACQLALLEDCTVTVPQERLLRSAAGREWGDADIRAARGGASTLRRVKVRLAEPSLEDQRADWERMAAGLKESGITAQLPDTASLDTLPQALRKTDWTIEALCDGQEFLWLAAGPGRRSCGFGIDLGTTTVDIALLDLETGELLDRKTLLNSQVAFGADVISRAMSFHDDPGPVRRAALHTIEEGAREILLQTGVLPDEVLRTLVVGNPIMIHILNGIDPYQLTRVPYTPVTCRSLRGMPRDFGWTFQEHGFVETIPLISAYVGADTVGMIVALGLGREDTTTLSIDVGTNGEIVLARGRELITTSTAAGPAFEGAQISCGMRALEGAIHEVLIAADGSLTVRVIGAGAPRGICGTGLVSGIAQLLDRGVVDSTGRLLAREEIDGKVLGSRVFSLGNELAFALSEDRSVFISQADIRKMQLAKGAVRTGIETLLDVTGVAVESLDALRLAGNFGSGLDPRAAMRIGLIPEMDPGKVEVVGNAALRGALMALLSGEARSMAEAAALKAKFIELGGRPEFQTRFMDSMLF
ncbi:MAG TPA: ASKHA domain-containing protein [Spirochaetia bacterium]|nr:ASKHA domain-containing protein [Spirochaetia bacterium]